MMVIEAKGAHVEFFLDKIYVGMIVADCFCCMFELKIK